MKVSARKEADGRTVTRFEGEKHLGSGELLAWIKALLESGAWKVTRGRVGISDDYDAPVQRDYIYGSLDEIKADMKHISEMDLDGFFLGGTCDGKEIGIYANVYGKKSLCITAPEGFDAEGLFKKLGIGL